MVGLFSLEKVRNAFIGFFRVSFMEEEQTSLSFLAVFDAVITEACDSFKFILQDLKDNDQYIGEQVLMTQKCVNAQRGRDTKSYSRIEKGGAIPHEIETCHKALFSKTAARSHGKCLDPFKSQVGISPGALQAELSNEKVQSN